MFLTQARACEHEFFKSEIKNSLSAKERVLWEVLGVWLTPTGPALTCGVSNHGDWVNLTRLSVGISDGNLQKV